MGSEPRKQQGLIGKKYARPLDSNAIKPICRYKPGLEEKNSVDKTYIDWLRMRIKQIIGVGLWSLMAAGFQVLPAEKMVWRKENADLRPSPGTPYHSGQQGNGSASDDEGIASWNMHVAFRGH